LCLVKSKRFTSLAHHARIESLARAAERDFRLSAFVMHGYHHLPLLPLLMLTVIDATPLLHEPLFLNVALSIALLRRCLARKRHSGCSRPPVDYAKIMRVFALTSLDLNQGENR